MGYSPCFFSKIGSFFKMLIIQKLLIKISSNLHIIRTSICIIKIGGLFPDLFNSHHYNQVLRAVCL